MVIAVCQGRVKLRSSYTSMAVKGPGQVRLQSDGVCVASPAVGARAPDPRRIAGPGFGMNSGDRLRRCWPSGSGGSGGGFGRARFTATKIDTQDQGCNDQRDKRSEEVEACRTRLTGELHGVTRYWHLPRFTHARQRLGLVYLELCSALGALGPCAHTGITPSSRTLCSPYCGSSPKSTILWTMNGLYCASP